MSSTDPHASRVASPADADADHPRLVFSAQETPTLRTLCQSTRGQAIMARLRRLLEVDPTAINIGFHAAGWALRHQIESDQSHAQGAARLAEMARADALLHSSPSARNKPLWSGSYKMILRTDPAVGLAYAYDMSAQAWSKKLRRTVARELVGRAKLFNDGGGKGWNDAAVSNWTANTASAAGLCAMAVLGDADADGAGEQLERAVARVRGFINHLGDRGWTQEPFQYYRYPLCHHLLPFIAAYRRLHHPDAFAGTGADWLAMLYVMLIRPGRDFVPMVNGGEDMHHSHFRSGDLAMGLATVQRDEHRHALRWLLEKRYGDPAGGGDGSHDIGLPHHAAFALAALARDGEPAEAVNPARVLGHVWRDVRKGLAIARDRWCDADDVICVVDGNENAAAGTFRGRHAGGFTLVGLGSDWLVSGRLRHAPREIHNVPEIDPLSGETDTRAPAPITAFTSRDDGSFDLTMDLSPNLHQPAVRRIILRMHPTDEVAAALKLTDRIDAAGVSLLFHSRFDPQRHSRGWSLHDGGRAYLHAVILSPSGDMPEIAFQSLADVAEAGHRVRVNAASATIAFVLTRQADPPSVDAARALFAD